MAPKPDEFPRWATVASTDPESGQPNVTEPPDSRKDNGWQRKERAAANWMNWLFNNIYQWILWAEGEIATLSGASGDYLVKSQNLNDLPNKGTARTNLSLVPGTNIQAYDAGLASIAGLTTAANTMIYATALDVYTTATLTAFGRSLLDDADATAGRTTLGLGTMATQANTAVNIDGGTIDGVAITAGTISGAAITGGTVSALDTDLAVADGGTGASTAEGARDNLEIQSFESDLLEIPTGTTPITQEHGLGATPRFFEAWLECIAEDRGYAVGDRTRGYWQQRSTLDIGGGPFITANATDLILYSGYNGTAASMPYVVNRGDSPEFRLSQVEQTGFTGKWKLRLVAKRK